MNWYHIAFASVNGCETDNSYLFQGSSYRDLYFNSTYTDLSMWLGCSSWDWKFIHATGNLFLQYEFYSFDGNTKFDTFDCTFFFVIFSSSCDLNKFLVTGTFFVIEIVFLGQEIFSCDMKNFLGQKQFSCDSYNYLAKLIFFSGQYKFLVTGTRIYSWERLIFAFIIVNLIARLTLSIPHTLYICRSRWSNF